MPHDDLTLGLMPPRDAAASPARQTPEVMTRLVRLPTTSPRQARAIVKLQLDRLSPLPVAETLFELVLVRLDGTEGVFALGVVRRKALLDPAFAGRRVIEARRIVEGSEAVFRFRNPRAADDRETRWMKHAPATAAIAVGLAALTLAAGFRSETWRERRLPEIVAAQRDTTRAVRALEQQTQARAEWMALERTDASTRLLCVMNRLSPEAPSGGLPITGLSAGPRQVELRLPVGADTGRLTALGAGADGRDTATGPKVTFPQDICR